MKLLLELAVAFAAGYLVAMGRVLWEETGYAMKRAEQQQRERGEWERLRGEALRAAGEAAKAAGSRIILP